MSEITSIIQGRVVDAATRNKLIDIIITVTSPSLQGERNGITDSSGVYKIEGLPSGEYTLRAEAFDYKPYSRDKIKLEPGQTTVINFELLPESIG